MTEFVSLDIQNGLCNIIVQAQLLWVQF